MLSVEEIPSKFDPKDLENFHLDSKIIWTRKVNLSDKDYDLRDRLHVCKLFEEANEGPQKVSIRSFAREWGISKSELSRWLIGYREWKVTGVLSMHGKRGRPRLIDEEGLESIRSKIQKLEKEQHSPSRAETHNIINVAVRETGIRNARGAQPLKKMSTRSMERYKSQVKLISRKRQFKTRARVRAESDPRNVYAMFCMAKAFSDERLPATTANFDATQFVVTANSNSLGYSVKPEGVDGQSDKPLTAESNGGLDFAIKFYHVNNALGFSSEPVYVIADDQLDASECKIYSVRGLGTNRVQNSIGWVCFTKSRACNPQFYRWFFHNILVEFANCSRKGEEYENLDGSKKPFFITCDGEAKQIEVFQEQDILQTLQSHRIILGKTPASCSAICQPSDASPFFKAAKKRLAYVPTGEKDADGVKHNYSLNEQLKDKLKKIIDENTSFSSDKRGLVVKSLMKVSWAVRTTLSEDIVQEGYKTIGQFPISFEAAMRQCTRSIPIAEWTNMEKKVGNMVDIYLKRGVVTESEMDGLLIWKVQVDTRSVDKDQRALYQQRAVIMNSQACIDQYKAYRMKMTERAATRLNIPVACRAGLSPAKYYDLWVSSLNPEEKRMEMTVMKDMGKVARRKIKVPELEAAQWTPAIAEISDENE